MNATFSPGLALRPRIFGVLLLVLSFILSPVWADHSAPAPQLGGVTLCLEPSSVQLEIESVVLSPTARQNVRQAVLDTLQKRLETLNISHTSDCTAGSYVLLSLYVRFLDPQTYLGFPENSYTYVTAAQVGGFVIDAQAETVLPESVYSASASDIFQAATPGELERRLVGLGEAEVEALTQTWVEANAVTPSSYLLFAAFGLSFAVLRVLTAFLR